MGSQLLIKNGENVPLSSEMALSETWFNNSIFPCYEEWKSIVYREVRNSKMSTEYCVSHPNLHLAKACIDNIHPKQVWSLTDQHPDSVRHLHVQVRLMG